MLSYFDLNSRNELLFIFFSAVFKYILSIGWYMQSCRAIFSALILIMHGTLFSMNFTIFSFICTISNSSTITLFLILSSTSIQNSLFLFKMSLYHAEFYTITHFLSILASLSNVTTGNKLHFWNLRNNFTYVFGLNWCPYLGYNFVKSDTCIRIALLSNVYIPVSPEAVTW